MTQHFMGKSAGTLQSRLSAYLRKRCPTAKHLAREISVDPRTASNYLNEYWPGAAQWQSIAAAFGDEVVNAVFRPDIDEQQARLNALIGEKEAELEALKARRSRVVGSQVGLAETTNGEPNVRPHRNKRHALRRSRPV